MTAPDEAQAILLGRPPEPEPLSVTAISLRTLLFLRPYRRQCLLIVLAIMIGVSFNAVFPLTLRQLIDNAAANQDSSLFVRLVVQLAVLYVAYAVAGIWRDRSTAQIVSQVMNDIRRKMFSHLQCLPLDFFQRRQVGDVVSHFSNDLSALEQPLRYSLPWSIHACTQILVSMVIIFLLNWQLALASILVLPLASIGPRIFSGRATAASDERRKQEAELSGAATEVVGGQVVIRAFGLQSSFVERFDTTLEDLLGSSFRSNFLALLVGRTTTVSVIFGQVLIIILGTLMVFRRELSVGSLIGFSSMLLNIGQSFGDLSTTAPDWLQATGSMRRIDNLLREQPQATEGPDARPAPRLSQSIEFRDVTFSYGGNRPILESVSLTIPAGTFVAFVGSSGSGKSTILNLMLRLYAPSSGQILFDGQPLLGISERSLRGQMGVVLQESFLFDTTIRENIRLGRPEANDEDVEVAAQAAQLHELIQTLPLGYDSPVGERGGMLSGGQRQRIALARAVLRDPAILVLDEATSALDPGTEAAFNDTLRQFARGRTVISVTHRLASVVAADIIFVMDGGRLAEHGTHQELLARGGLYAKLWQKQAGFILSEDGLRARIDVERLAEIPLFSGIATPLLEPVVGVMFTERFREGETVFREGDLDDRFYVLVRGTIAVTKRTAGGEVAQIEVLEDGDFLGDVDLLQGEKRTTTATARTECVALALTGEQFRRLVESAPVLRAIFLQVAEVRNQQEGMREAAAQGVAGWSDTA